MPDLTQTLSPLMEEFPEFSGFVPTNKGFSLIGIIGKGPNGMAVELTKEDLQRGIASGDVLAEARKILQIAFNHYQD